MISYSLYHDSVNFGFLKLLLFDIAEFLLWNIKGPLQKTKFMLSYQYDFFTSRSGIPIGNPY